MALPEYRSVIFEGIPDELKNIPNWVLWNLEYKKDYKTGEMEIDNATGKPRKTKIPYSVNGRKAKADDPNTWGSYHSVVKSFNNNPGKYAGIGWEFTEEAGIIGVDWDKVRDPITGEWDKEALEEILNLCSYAELSQSGTGAHCIIKGKIPGDRRRKGNIEMYSGLRWNEIKQKFESGRFFVVTGQRIEGSPEEIRENQEAIDKLYEKRFGAEKKENNKCTTAAKESEKSLRSPKMSDDEILQHCRIATNSEKFIKLYDKGEWKEFDYPSQSEADYALCFMLAFYTQDDKQLDRLFRKGKLYREEWDRTSKYTMDKVLSQVTEVYNLGKKGKNSLYPYILTPKGVGKFVDIKDPDDPSNKISIIDYFLHTPVKITALSDDLDGEKILYKIEIDHPINGSIELWKDQGELLTRSGINKLLSEGLISTDSSYKDVTKYFMLDMLRASTEAQKEFVAHKTGWKRENSIFVAGNEAYTAKGVTRVNLINKDISEALKKAGTVEGWVNGCKWVLQYESSRINCYTSCSSVIACLLKQPSPILQNKGVTTSGKTLKSSVGVSISGNPTLLIKSADTTRTAAERDAIATNGIGSVYDEVGLLKNPDGLTYLLSNGRKKNRGTKDGLEESANWFKSFILNGEFEFLKESAAQGEIGRLVECSWTLPTDAVNAKRTEVEIKEHYGHIMPLFLSKLFSRLDAIKDRYTELCSQLPASTLDIGSRLRDTFALIIIAGEILEDVFEDIGIEKKDPYAICEKLYLENIGSERVKPYWIRGLGLIIDEVNACKMEIGVDGEETGKFYHKGQMGGDTFGLYIDINTAVFKDMCDKHELKHSQLMQDWRDKGITEVDKPDNKGNKKSQKTIKENGIPKKIIRLIKLKVGDALKNSDEEESNISSDSPKYDRETIEIVMVKHDLLKHLNFQQDKTLSSYVIADSFLRENPGLKKHYTVTDIVHFITDIGKQSVTSN